MKKTLSILILFLLSLAAFPQLSFDSLLSSFTGFENGNFDNYLDSNGFKQTVSSSKTSESWHLAPGDKESGEILIVKKTRPWNSLWIEFIQHSNYYKVSSDIAKKCKHAGFFGCSEVETWDSYKHSSGIEFRLIELPDSRETGTYVIEVIQK